MAEGHTTAIGIRASRSALLGLLLAALCAASCRRAPPPAPPHEAPARALTLTDGHLSLEASARVELHTWLSAAARSDEEVPPELEAAKNAYARSLLDDDEDAMLARTVQALAACPEDACATAAVAAEGFGHAYARALPLFTARWWLPRATAAWGGIEAAHVVLGPVAEALLVRAAGDLSITLPEQPIKIPVVSAVPAVGRAALIPIALSTRGRCFIREPRPGVSDVVRVNDARLLDCILVHALLGPRLESTLRSALTRDLGVRDGERAWSVLVVHGVAVLMTGWDANHLSVYRRSALAVEGKVLEWLAKEWRGARTEPFETFAARYAAQWRATRARND